MTLEAVGVEITIIVKRNGHCRLRVSSAKFRRNVEWENHYHHSTEDLNSNF